MNLPEKFRPSRAVANVRIFQGLAPLAIHFRPFGAGDILITRCAAEAIFPRSQAPLGNAAVRSSCFEQRRNNGNGQIESYRLRSRKRPLPPSTIIQAHMHVVGL